ncbi:MAG TPA: LacI family DNA-binding transcriptional regulator [Chloroflexota bacterium]|jgi:LacI family transcriptional regulator|nr:LacI family DNA-binding transcriptional regulator [Chloroflexota bacterium]
MATVHDVARRAGVSTSTVSHVVNNTRFVSDELRGRVLEAMRELDYTPNAAARMLTLKRSHTIGLIVSDIRNPFFASVARGVEDVAQEQGYTLVLCNSDESFERESACLTALETRAVDGVLLASAGVADEHLARLVRAGFPIVLVDRDLPELGVPAVLLNNEGAAYRAVLHLITRGHRRIAMLSGRAAISTTTERVAGYQRALREAGIALDERLVASGASTSEGGLLAANAVLDLDDPPSAIFSGNNLMSIGALQAIVNRGLSVPEGVALVGFDDFPFPWSDAFRPHLTTVAQPTYELGRRAAELLVQRLKRPGSLTAERVVLDGKLVVRESSGALPSTHQRKTA